MSGSAPDRCSTRVARLDSNGSPLPPGSLGQYEPTRRIARCSRALKWLVRVGATKTELAVRTCFREFPARRFPHGAGRSQTPKNHRTRKTGPARGRRNARRSNAHRPSTRPHCGLDDPANAAAATRFPIHDPAESRRHWPRFRRRRHHPAPSSRVACPNTNFHVAVLAASASLSHASWDRPR